MLAAFKPLPADLSRTDKPASSAQIALGRQLYHEARLSKNHDVSCNSCHLLDKFGVDGDKTSMGHRKQRGDRNSPTVYNAAGHIAQFWDGRAATIEEQAKGPVLNPVEMAMPDEAAVVAVLKSIPGYVEAFGQAFPGEADPVTYDNMAHAIGAFERKLVTPGRFDTYLAGDETALSDAEKQGLAVFLSTGCTTCHAGAYLGGHMYQKLGLVKAWPHQEDPGRFKVTKSESDRMFFKVPSLRNVAKTGPYFHDGSVTDLGEAVAMMAEYQLGRTLSADDTKSIVAFLGALTGEVPQDLVAPPKLPASGPNTPKPDAS
ncbi:MAG: c-type cytochrome [Myxococcales bacterium FL481]|nr:MAG: c-type cytochrome [Myxococcales bacterium FL481]